MNHFPLLIVILGISLVYAGNSDYGYGDHEDCGNVKRDEHGVPLSLIPPDSDLVLLAIQKGYRAYTFNSILGFWLEFGHQVQLYLASDLKFSNVIGDVSTDAKSVEPITVPNIYQTTYFADGSYITRKATEIFTDYTSCDPFQGIFPSLSSSSYPGILTCVTYVSIFDSKGGFPPPLHKQNTYHDGQVFISPSFNYAAYYCTSIPSYLSNTTIVHHDGDQYDQGHGESYYH